MGGEGTMCTVCCMAPETLIHLFKKCSGLRALAFGSDWGGKTEAWEVETVDELIDMCLDPPSLL